MSVSWYLYVAVNGSPLVIRNKPPAIGAGSDVSVLRNGQQACMYRLYEILPSDDIPKIDVAIGEVLDLGFALGPSGKGGCVW